jgi:predicted secreted hydrolase
VKHLIKAPLCVLSCVLLFARGALAAPVSYPPVVPGHALRFPLDSGAHPEFKTEWWYVTGWLTRADGTPLGFQVTFFRSRTAVGADNPSSFAPRQLVVAHAAISDPAVRHLVHDQKSGRAGFDLNYARSGITALKLDDWSMRRGANGVYTVAITSNQLQLQLTLTPTQAPLLQGENGYSQKGPQARNASYYYSEPQLKVTGSAGTGKGAATVTGTAWFDHEWSSEALDPAASGWDWVGANFDDGSALMAFQIRAKSGSQNQGGKLWAHAALRDRTGKVTQFGPGQVSFTPRTLWKSPVTGAVYPVATTIVTGTTQWRLAPLQPDQELDSRRSTGAVYWEGAVTIERDGARAGHGYLEMTGYDRAMTL